MAALKCYKVHEEDKISHLYEERLSMNALLEFSGPAALTDTVASSVGWLLQQARRQVIVEELTERLLERSNSLLKGIKYLTAK